MTHDIKTWMPYFQDILDGKKPFEFRKNDRNYLLGDTVIHNEYDPDKKEATGRIIHADISYIIYGPDFGIPDGFCVFAQQTFQHRDFVSEYSRLSVDLLPQYEQKLSTRYGGNLSERLRYVLSSLDEAATNSIYKAKHFIEDTKTQFKALEIIVQGISSDAYNHGQKRVIANHVIYTIRECIDRIDKFDWNYSSGMYEHFNFYRSNTPERGLMNKVQELKQQVKRLQSELGKPDDEDTQDEIPF